MLQHIMKLAFLVHQRNQLLKEKKLPQLLNNFLHPPEEPTLLDLVVERPERVVERLEGQANVLFE